MVNQAGRGARAENDVRDELGGWGYDVIRSAASKGAADLWAVHDGGEIIFVQVKLGEWGRPFKMPSPAERDQLVRLAHRANGAPVAACRIPGAGSRAAYTHYRLLTGTGPKDWLLWTPSVREGMHR